MKQPLGPVTCKTCGGRVIVWYENDGKAIPLHEIECPNGEDHSLALDLPGTFLYAEVVKGNVPNPAHSVQPISCPHCKTKMVVQHEARLGAGTMTTEVVPCIECKKEFNILLPGPLIGGPFPE